MAATPDAIDGAPPTCNVCASPIHHTTLSITKCEHHFHAECINSVLHYYQRNGFMSKCPVCHKAPLSLRCVCPFPPGYYTGPKTRKWSIKGRPMTTLFRDEAAALAFDNKIIHQYDSLDSYRKEAGHC